MSEILIAAIIFFIIAMVYASAGFGGGSSYLAVLALCSVPLVLMPRFSLACNIIVVIGGTYVFYKSGHLDIRRVMPFIIGSIPLSFIGGMININKTLFLTLLATALMAASANMILFSSAGGNIKALSSALISREKNVPGYRETSAGLLAGGALGFLSGLVGIGGGVFLAPLLYMLRWGQAKEIAAASSLFILLNSISGLAGQLTKGGIDTEHLAILPLAAAVFAGGQIGSRLGAVRFSQLVVRNITAGLVMLAGMRIFIKVYV